MHAPSHCLARHAFWNGGSLLLAGGQQLVCGVVVFFLAGFGDTAFPFVLVGLTPKNGVLPRLYVVLRRCCS